MPNPKRAPPTSGREFRDFFSKPPLASLEVQLKAGLGGGGDAVAQGGCWVLGARDSVLVDGDARAARLDVGFFVARGGLQKRQKGRAGEANPACQAA